MNLSLITLFPLMHNKGPAPQEALCPDKTGGLPGGRPLRL